MDLSGIIFVALAVAWAAYLIPKALRHHDEVDETRSVERFSHTMRVLARREPISKRDARLIVATKRPSAASDSVVEPATRHVDRASTRKATQRRRRVLGLLLLVNVAVAAAAGFGVISWFWSAAPAALVVAWLVACRLMVKKERARPASYADPAASDPLASDPVGVPVQTTVAVERNEQGFDELDPANVTQPVPAVRAGDPELWDPLPMTLPTYVNKPAAKRRSVRTIALDDSDVWTSGRTEADSAIAREAEHADKADREARKADGERAVGS